MNGAVEALKSVRVRRYGKRCQNRKERLCYILLMLFVVRIFASVLGTLGYGMIRQRTYWSYVKGLARATTYAYIQDGVRVTEGECSYQLSGEDVYIPYQLLGDINPGRPWREEPVNRDTILFDFGDGSSLQIWDVPMEDGTKGYEYGLYVRYCNQSGKIFQFDLDGITLDKIRERLNNRENEASQ